MAGPEDIGRWAWALGVAAAVALAGVGMSVWQSRGAGKAEVQERGAVPRESPKGKAAAVAKATGTATVAAGKKERKAAEAGPGPVRSTPANRDREMEAARARVAELEAANERLRMRLDDMLSWIVDNVQGRFPLPEAQMANLRIEPADEEGAVSGDLAEVLRMTDEELGRLDEAWTGARELLREMEEAGIRLEDGDGTTWAKLSFDPYGDDGGLVRDYIYEETLATLGKGRFLRFLQVAGEGLEKQFDSFGDRERTLEIDVLADGGEGESLFIRDEVRKKDPEDPMKQTGTSLELVTGTLPKEYERYLGHFPELVGRFAEPGGARE